jgi:hypothetical protein
MAGTALEEASPAEVSKRINTGVAERACRKHEESVAAGVDDPDEDFEDVTPEGNGTAAEGEVRVLLSGKQRQPSGSDRFFAASVHRTVLLALCASALASDRSASVSDSSLCRLCMHCLHLLLPNHRQKASSANDAGAASFDSLVTLGQQLASGSAYSVHRSDPLPDLSPRERIHRAAQQLSNNQSSAWVHETDLALVLACALRGLGWHVRTVRVLDPGPMRPTPMTLAASDGFNVRRMLKGGIESAMKRTLRGSVSQAVTTCRSNFAQSSSNHASALVQKHYQNEMSDVIELDDSSSQYKQHQQQQQSGHSSSKKSTHSNGDPYESAHGPMAWIEVLTVDRTKCERWVPILLSDGSIDKPERAQDNRTLRYVFAFNCGACKDVTLRYARHWSESGRHRTESEWLNDFMKPLSNFEKHVLPCPVGAEQPERTLSREEFSKRVQKSANMLKEEDIALEAKLITEKVPTQASKLKNHPLYVMEKHLSRNEVVHPRNTKTIVGFVDGQPVFPRKCVRELKTADAWLRDDNRKVRQEERDNPVKGSTSSNSARGAALYGEWQTEEYIQEPVGSDGSIPKNEKGNVDLARFASPPPGAVYIKGTGVALAARQAGVDSAEALVGFERRRGSSKAVPKFDGAVVAHQTIEPVLEQLARNDVAQSREKKRKREAQAAERWRSLLGTIWTRSRLDDMEEDGGEQQAERDQLGEKRTAFEKDESDDDNNDEEQEKAHRRAKSLAEEEQYAPKPRAHVQMEEIDNDDDDDEDEEIDAAEERDDGSDDEEKEKR